MRISDWSSDVCSSDLLLDGSGGTHTDALRGIQSADAMLVFSVAPYSRASIDAARYAAERRATIVAVTDSVVSPLAALTRHVLQIGRASCRERVCQYV